MTNRILFPVALAVAAIFVVAATLREHATEAAADAAATKVVSALPASMPGTSRDELRATVSTMTERLRVEPGDATAVVALANALIRLQRVNNDGRAVIVAEEQLRTFLTHNPEHYEAQRMLAAVLLSQHRFGDAIAEANKAMAIDPRDAWNYGAAGDGYMELGDYTRAFEAYDRMGQLQPGPPAYARTSYGLEIKGDLEGALDYMRRAADGTSPNDAESQAWHYAQVGEILAQLGRHTQARIEFERAEATFPATPWRLPAWRASSSSTAIWPAPASCCRRSSRKPRRRTLRRPSLNCRTRSASRSAPPSITRWPNRSSGVRGGAAPGSRRCLRKLLAERPGRTAEAVGLRGRSCARPRRHPDHGHAGLGVFQEWPAVGGATGGGSGDAHRHAQRPHPCVMRR